jgi:hypothetical protein
VTAYDSSLVRAYDSSSVTAHDSSSVTAHDSSSVRAHDSSSVRAYDSSSVTAYGKNSVVTIHSKYAKVSGKNIITVQPIASLQEWFDEYGLAAVDGVVTLFKSVNVDYTSSHNYFAYTPGTVPIAPDWDGGVKECGGGLHLCPTPGHALQFQDGPKFVACPVRVEDIAFHQNADYPTKVKAKGCCGPVWECDINGNKK